MVIEFPDYMGIRDYLEQRHRDKVLRNARAAVASAKTYLGMYNASPDCKDPVCLVRGIDQLVAATRLRNQNHDVGGMPTLVDIDDALADLVAAGMNGSSRRARLDEFLDTKISWINPPPRDSVNYVAGVPSTLTNLLSQRFIERDYRNLLGVVFSMAEDVHAGNAHFNRLKEAADICNDVLSTALDWGSRDNYRIRPSNAKAIAAYTNVLLNKVFDYKTPLDDGELSPTEQDLSIFSDNGLEDFRYITDELGKALSMADDDAEDTDKIAESVHSIYELYHKRHEAFSRWANAQQDMKYNAARIVAEQGNPVYAIARDDFIKFLVSYSTIVDEPRELLKEAVERLDAVYSEAINQKSAEPEPAKPEPDQNI